MCNRLILNILHNVGYYVDKGLEGSKLRSCGVLEGSCCCIMVGNSGGLNSGVAVKTLRSGKAEDEPQRQGLSDVLTTEWGG